MSRYCSTFTVHPYFPLVITLHYPIFPPLQLHAAREQLAAANASTLIVCFGDADGARRWTKDVGHDFPMVADQNKHLYSGLFGLQSGSFFSVFGLSSISYYVRAAWSGKAIPKGRPGDDIYQLGGDAVLDGGDDSGKNKGKILFTYASKNPADRPSIDDLLNELQK